MQIQPYVKLCIDGKVYGQTKVIYKTLNPVWNESIKVELNTAQSNHLLQRYKNGLHQQQKPTFELFIYDKDELSDDDSMGIVRGVLPFDTPPQKKWMEVVKAPGHTKPVTGEIEFSVDMSIRKLLSIEKGNSLSLRYNNTINVNLDWKFEDRTKKIDLDTSCVAVDQFGNILMDETVYFGDLYNSNRSIVHSGDVTAGGGKGEQIRCQLSRINTRVKALYFILTVATPKTTFEQVKSASVKVGDERGNVLCMFTPSLVGDHTAMFLMRIARKDNRQGQGWTMTIIEDTDHTARDFGSLIPEIKGYCRDFVPGIVIHPNERIAIMRKDGNAIRIRDYAAPNQPVPNRLTFGLAWDVTNGVNIDLDASAICLDSSLNVVDIISYSQLRSKDGAILHGGDEREGDEIGDDEKIFLHLNRLNPDIAHVVFVINSYSGQELDDVSKASCHLFDSATRVDIATYQLSHNSSLDKKTALIMASLFRENGDGQWCMRIISEATIGRVARDVVGKLQRFLRENPLIGIQEVPEPDVIVNEMPEDVEITVDPVVPAHEISSNIFVPPVPSTKQSNSGGAATGGPVIPSFS